MPRSAFPTTIPTMTFARFQPEQAQAERLRGQGQGQQRAKAAQRLSLSRPRAGFLCMSLAQTFRLPAMAVVGPIHLQDVQMDFVAREGAFAKTMGIIMVSEMRCGATPIMLRQLSQPNPRFHRYCLVRSRMPTRIRQMLRRRDPRHGQFHVSKQDNDADEFDNNCLDHDFIGSPRFCSVSQLSHGASSDTDSGPNNTM